jgi:His/Glu/Gln/Arg/opine family amino acid ABC transporter permease subunit
MERLLDNYFNLGVLGAYYPAILGGFLVTVEVAILTVVLGIGAGLLLAVLRNFRHRAVNALIVGYVDVFRTLPQIVVIVVLYFALPYAGVRLSPFGATVVALAAVLSAFSAEIFWSAIKSISSGQSDAAAALGFKAIGTLFLVILPQAMRLAIPMLTNRAIAIIKGTALGTAVSLPEVLGQAQSAMAIAANPSPLTLAAALYLLLFIPLVVASRWVEQRFGRLH